MTQTLRLSSEEAALLEALLAQAEGPAAESLRRKMEWLDFTPARREPTEGAARGFSSKAVATKRREA